MPEFQVDTGQVADAAGRLGGVASALDAAYGGVNFSALGFPSAEAALANFVAAWTSGGAVLARALSDIQRSLATTADNYEHAEQVNSCIAPPGLR
jgi:uncharacterized protein YukE